MYQYNGSHCSPIYVATFLGPAGCVRAIKRIGDAINMGNKRKQFAWSCGKCFLWPPSGVLLALYRSMRQGECVNLVQRTHTLPNMELVQLTLTLQHDDDARVNGNFWCRLIKNNNNNNWLRWQRMRNHCVTPTQLGSRITNWKRIRSKARNSSTKEVK